jgi:hypothetical protein
MQEKSASSFAEAQQEAEYELEAIEITTAGLHVCEGLEGGFISFDQHALMLSTIDRLVDCVFANILSSSPRQCLLVLRDS